MRTQESEAERLPVRSNVETPDATEGVTKDEEDFSTLKEVAKILREGVAKCNSINVIEVESKVPVEQQVLAFQAAAATLETALLAVTDAIGDVKLKQRGIK